MSNTVHTSRSASEGKKKPVKSHVNMLQQSEHLNIMNTTRCMGDMCVGWTSTENTKTGSHTPFYNTCNDKLD